MIKVLYALVFALAVGQVSCGGGGGGSASPNSTSSPAQSPETASSLEEILDRGVAKGLDGVFLYVLREGESPQALAAGLEDRASQRPADPGSLFKIASISKMFLAVASVQLIDQGLLQLDDRLSMLLPHLAGSIENADQISLQNLLQHESGIPDFDSAPSFSWENAHTDIDDTLSLVLDKSADFLPGSRYEYSNTNYLLLSKILDEVLGFNHTQHVQNEILNPLGLVDTYLNPESLDTSRLARGYWNGIERSGQLYVIPGGSLISTARDTAVFVQALANQELLSDSASRTYRQLFTGYGHSGWVPGYQSIARYHSRIEAVVVQFVNTTGSGSEDVSAQVYDEVLDYIQREM